MRNEHAAEDLTQQVLITTLEALRAGRLREAEKLVSFVLGTCRMTVLDLRRNAQRRDRLLKQFGADLLTPGQPSLPRFDRDTDRPLCAESEGTRTRSRHHDFL